MGRLWLAAVLVWAGSPIPAQEPPKVAEEVRRLAAIKAHMREILTRLPDYTCVQLIERTQRTARTKRFRLVDTVRLEVALVGGKELFAWPGAGKFEDREISKMVGGTVGNGNFALHARSVFLGGGAQFEYEGEREQEGRRLYRYRFRVPRNLSGYLLRSGALEGVTAYHGWFEAEAETLDLRRLEVEAEDIPAHLPIAAARDHMEYARVPIGERAFLLPKSSELVLTDLEGTENRNVTTFSGCKQYTGESVISFADPDAVATAAPAPAVAVELPAGLGLTVVFDESLRFDKAARGDQLTGRVVENARWKGQTMVPRGAVVKARLLGFQRYYWRQEMIRAWLVLTRVEFPGAVAEVDGQIEDITTLPGWTRAMVDKQGMINIGGTRLELPRGLRTVWRIRGQAGKESK
jgi:hypothetical protein